MGQLIGNLLLPVFFQFWIGKFPQILGVRLGEGGAQGEKRKEPLSPEELISAVWDKKKRAKLGPSWYLVHRFQAAIM